MAAADEGGGAAVRSQMRLPIPHVEVGYQNGYRVVPWTSVNGESEASPF